MMTFTISQYLANLILTPNVVVPIHRYIIQHKIFLKNNNK